jgi:hypothetical protein
MHYIKKSNKQHQQFPLNRQNQFRYYGVIPDDFNVSHIIPIKKDKKLKIDHISISNILAQIFERLLLNKMSEINKTHDNQFGYKNKTSCIIL